MSSIDGSRDDVANSVRRLAQRSLSLRMLEKFGITPNRVTVSFALISVVGAVIWSFQSHGHWQFWTGIGVFLLGGCGDFLDGAVATKRNMKSDEGAFLDSMTDRIVEGTMYLAIGLAVAHHGHADLAFLGIMPILVGSFVITYARAKAEQQKVKGNIGLADRMVRMVFTGVFVILSYWWPIEVYYAMVVAMNLLVWHTVYVRGRGVYVQIKAKPTNS